jgi:hypothetical protein
MEKTRRLVLALEGLALVVATVLILVDYKLKNDLVDLYRKMEGSLERGRQFMGQEPISPADTNGVRTGDMASNDASLEAAVAHQSTNGNGSTRGTNNGTTAKRSGRTGSAPLPKFDNGLGS